MMLYPTVLGFCLAVKLGHFDLLMPTPHLDSTPAPAAALGSNEDLWRTDGPANIGLLVGTCISVSIVHLAITAFLVLRSGEGGAYLRPLLSYPIALVLWVVSTLYLFYFVSVAR